MIECFPESKMSKKESESQDEWVFDSLVGFLRGPVWNVPILTFIEHKSLSKMLMPVPSCFLDPVLSRNSVVLF